MWKESIVTDGHDTDHRGFVRPACVLRYIQSAANGEMRHYGPSNEALWDEGKAFLLSRVLLVLYRPIRAYEQLTASSFGCGGKGLRFLRCGRVTCGDEVVLPFILLKCGKNAECQTQGNGNNNSAEVEHHSIG